MASTTLRWVTPPTTHGRHGDCRWQVYYRPGCEVLGAAQMVARFLDNLPAIVAACVDAGPWFGPPGVYSEGNREEPIVAGPCISQRSAGRGPVKSMDSATTPTCPATRREEGRPSNCRQRLFRWAIPRWSSIHLGTESVAAASTN